MDKCCVLHVLSRVRCLVSVLSLAVGTVSSGALSAQVPVSFPSTDSLDAEDINAGPGLSDVEYACVASIPRAQMAPVPVFLHAALSDGSVAALGVQADLMAQDVSEEMLALLGGGPSNLPLVDPKLTPLSVPAELIVIEHPDGSATRKAFSRFGDTSATALLVRAFDAARAKSEGIIVWPDGYRADSVIVRLLLLPGILPVRGRIVPPRAKRLQFGVFRVLQPFESPALAKPAQPAPRYPPELESHRVEGSVLLQFVIDTSGKAVPSTIRDLHPANDSELNGLLGQEHMAFARSLAAAVIIWRFEPAHIGPCTVRQIVQLPVKFEAP